MKQMREGWAERLERESTMLAAIARHVRAAADDEPVRDLMVLLNTYRDCDHRGDREGRDRYMAEIEARLGARA